jgi:nicotinic acid phosphoribosyltransferase
VFNLAILLYANFTTANTAFGVGRSLTQPIRFVI